MFDYMQLKRGTIPSSSIWIWRRCVPPVMIPSTLMPRGVAWRRRRSKGRPCLQRKGKRQCWKQNQTTHSQQEVLQRGKGRSRYHSFLNIESREQHNREMRTTVGGPLNQEFTYYGILVVPFFYLLVWWWWVRFSMDFFCFFFPKNELRTSHRLLAIL